MQVLARLCDRAILLRGGEVVKDGPSEEVVAHYLQTEAGQGSQRVWADAATAPQNKRARLRSARVVDEDGHLLDAADVRRPVGIEIAFTVLRDDVAIFPKIKVLDQKGDTAFNAMDMSPVWESAVVGDHSTTAWVPGNLLNEGLYSVEVSLCSLGAFASTKLIHQAVAPDALSFHVNDPSEGDSSKGRFAGQLRGAVRPLLDWTPRP
jgi:homopolymeric O-antigen transport system ATP-binding protein